MRLLTGSWELYANGIEGKLFIESVEQDGTVRGEIFDDKLLELWNETTQRLLFMHAPEAMTQLQVFQGYLYADRVF